VCVMLVLLMTEWPGEGLFLLGFILYAKGEGAQITT
jgi:hypothetical protein